MVGAANCSMKNDVCDSFTYAEAFQMMSNIFLPRLQEDLFKPAAPIFAQSVRVFTPWWQTN